MANVRPVCQKCRSKATCNFEGIKTPAYCKSHAVEGMVYAGDKRCLYGTCTMGSVFNFDGVRPAVYCKKHAEDGMVDVCSKRCLYDSCIKAPTYNFKGVRPAAWCKRHAKDGMLDIRRRRCLSYSCAKEPIYSFGGIKPGVYCGKHAEDGMVSVRTQGQPCLHGSCTTLPTYNFEGRKPAHCKLHAEEGMVYLRAKRSSNDSCTAVGDVRRLPTDDVPTVCVAQKREVLECPVASVGVEAQCGVAGCLKRQNSGIDGKQPNHCLDHAPRPFENGLATHIAAAVEMVRSEEGFRSSPSLGLGAHLDDNGGGGELNGLVSHTTDDAVEMACSAGGSPPLVSLGLETHVDPVKMAVNSSMDRSSSSLGWGTHPDRNGGGREPAAKRIRHRLYRRPLSPQRRNIPLETASPIS